MLQSAQPWVSVPSLQQVGLNSLLHSIWLHYMTPTCYFVRFNDNACLSLQHRPNGKWQHLRAITCRRIQYGRMSKNNGNVYWQHEKINTSVRWIWPIGAVDTMPSTQYVLFQVGARAFTPMGVNVSYPWPSQARPAYREKSTNCHWIDNKSTFTLYHNHILR